MTLDFYQQKKGQFKLLTIEFKRAPQNLRLKVNSHLQDLPLNQQTQNQCQVKMNSLILNQNPFFQTRKTLLSN